MATITRSTPSPLVMGIMNPVMRFAITRGFGSIGDQLMVLHWTGRKTGTAYATPVGRHELDGQLFTITKAAFKHNFVGGGPAELVLDGSRRPFTATVVDSPEVVGTRMRALLDALGPTRGARALASKIDGEPTVEELTEFASDQGAVVLDFEPR
ncbi:MAG: hypothetical protein AAGA93_26335 [Actinomycetota bacterium]